MVNPIGLDEGYDDLPWSTMDHHEMSNWFPQSRFDFYDDEISELSPSISVLDTGFQQQVLNRNKFLQHKSIQNSTLQLKQLKRKVLNLQNQYDTALRGKHYVDITRLRRKITETSGDIKDTERDLKIAKRSFANIRNYMNRMSDSD
eukprot:GHVR01021936.1.p1 GENE.GHVR01021936.1~~GHVR01021936.1.p1  ORF type:complete len:146 (+),score=12.84 GHVR01021936.1:124-561(+)